MTEEERNKLLEEKHAIERKILAQTNTPEDDDRLNEIGFLLYPPSEYYKNQKKREPIPLTEEQQKLVDEMNELTVKVNNGTILTEEKERLFEIFDLLEPEEDDIWEKMTDEEKESYYFNFISSTANERICGFRMERHLKKDGKWEYDFISEDDDNYC